MVEPLLSALRRAEAVEPVLGADEVAQWAEDAIARLAGLGLLAEISPANGATCDACHDEHYEEVVSLTYPDGVIRRFIRCPQSGRVEVEYERLRRWTVDLNGLAAASHGALLVAGEIERIVPDRLWSLGRTTIGLTRLHIFLARGLAWSDADDVVRHALALIQSGPALVLVPARPPAASAWGRENIVCCALTQLAAFGSSDRFEVDRAALEVALGRRRGGARATPVLPIPAPPGSSWSDIRLEVGDDELIAFVGHIRVSRSAQDAGLWDRGKYKPDLSWSVLRAFAFHHGRPPTGRIAALEGERGAGNVTKASNRAKKRVQRLNDCLLALFPGFEERPIGDEEGRYQCGFTICATDGPVVSIPASAGWGGLSLTELRDGGIRAEWDIDELYDASERASGEAIAAVAATKVGTESVDLTLVRLRLAAESGHPTELGALFLELLRAGGRLERPSDDSPMVKLGAVLTAAFGIGDGSPFDFLLGERGIVSGEWRATFTARREREVGR